MPEMPPKRGVRVSEYINKRGQKLLDELIEMLESEWDYCPQIEELKRIKEELFGFFGGAG